MPIATTKFSMLVFAILIVIACAFESQAATRFGSPELKLIMPRGVQRGLEHTLTFSGARLADAEEVFFYDEGVEFVKIDPIDVLSISVTVRVASDCRLGEHIAQVRTKTGISDYRSFYVGAMKETAESGADNNTFESAERIDCNVTVNGLVTNEDVDYFVVAAKKDQRLSVEIEAIRLGAMFDPFIAVLDKDRFEIAVSDDTPLFKQDGMISFKVPEDGDYFLMVRETSYGGNEFCHYRLHVGNFPRPTIAYPGGGQAGQKTEVTLLGDPLGEIKKEIEVLEDNGFRPGQFHADDHGVTPSPLPFRVREYGNVFETEPNNSFGHAGKQEPIASLPIAINGILDRPNDFDYHRIRCQKDGVYHIECFGRRLGSAIDPVLNIFGPDKNSIVGDDDSKRPDCYVRFVAPDDGDYFIRVYDRLRRGTPEFVYRIEVEPANPRLAFYIPRVDRFSQKRQAIAVPKNNRFATLMQVTRFDFGGTLRLLDDSLPPGVKMTAPDVLADQTTIPVLFEATEEAEISGELVELTCRHVENEEIEGQFVNVADFALGEPNNAAYFKSHVDKLAVAVTHNLPFRIDIVQPKSPLVRNGSKNIKVVATRAEGFDRPIRVQFPFRPPGVSTKPTVVIPKGKSEINYPLNANGKAKLGKWPVYAIGSANVNGERWGATQLVDLEIADPFTIFEMNRTRCVRGESARIECKLTHQRPFEGEAKAIIRGVPPNITIPPLNFTKDTTELVFDVTTNEKSPIGKHKGIHCQIVVPHNGDEVVSVAGRSELQITKPKPPRKEVAKSESNKDAPLGAASSNAPPQPDGAAKNE